MDYQCCSISINPRTGNTMTPTQKPRMREDVMAAYQAMVKAKAAKIMKALEKVDE